VSDAMSHPRILELPRDENELATSTPAIRRIKQLLPAFLDDMATTADADGFVVTIDGAPESAVAATMAAEALGPDRVTGLVMPAQLTDEAPARDAEAVASSLGIEHHRLQLRPLFAAFQEIIGTTGEPADDLVAMHNAGARFRMACAYYVANTRNRLVVGTVNRTDRLLGSVAKYGENGVDVSLLGDLYRTEVLALARDLGVPEGVRSRSSRYHGRATPSDAEQLGIDQTTLDSLLRLTVDEGDPPEVVADRLDIDTSVVRRVKTWCAATRHKRHSPPKPSMGT